MASVLVVDALSTANARSLAESPYVLHWVFIEDVLIDALNFARIEINGHNRRLLGNQNSFRLAEQFGSLVEVRLHISLVDQLIVPRVLPAGAIVAAIAHEYVEESVGIIVVADPTGGGEIEIKPRLSAVKYFALDLAQFDFDPEFRAPHLLQLDRDQRRHFAPAASAGEERVLETGEPFSARETGLGQQFAPLLRI